MARKVCVHIEIEKFSSQHRRAGEGLLNVVKAWLLSLNRLPASPNEVRS